MDNPKETVKRKNSNLSILLIAINMVLLLVFTNINYHSEDAEIRNWLLCVIALTALLGGYAFSYHGKGYRLAKWLFGLMLLIALAMTGLLWYATQLGHAFQH